MRVVILGAGGHGQVVADICLRMADAGAALSLAGFLDDDTGLHGRAFLGVPVLGPVACLASVPHDAVVVAIGSNRTRQRLAAELTRQGERFAVPRHPSAVIAPDAVIGPGSIVCAGVVIGPTSVIGAHAIMNTGSTIDHHNRVGDFAHIAPGVHLGGDVQIGEGTLVGIGSSVLPQRAVGDWTIVGAGSVVTKDIPSGVTAMGIPARIRQAENGGGRQAVFVTRVSKEKL